MSAILATSLKAAKTSALSSTISQLQSKLLIAENNIANLNVGLSSPDDARSAIINISSSEYKKAFLEYLQILFDTMSQNEATAIQAYFNGPVVVNVSMAKLICP